ncbi:MAG: GNAT family N-acetyltransferase [Pseudomonadota bacterium]
MTETAPQLFRRNIAFRPASPDADRRTLIAFGAGLYIASTGSTAAFYRDYGPYGVRFPVWIARCADRDPGFAAIMTHENQDIGFVVLGADAKNPAIGCVHHLYVREDRRGYGFGGVLDDYARDALRAAGYDEAMLNVTPINARAIRFYEAQGWRPVSSQDAWRRRSSPAAFDGQTLFSGNEAGFSGDDARFSGDSDRFSGDRAPRKGGLLYYSVTL